MKLKHILLTAVMALLAVSASAANAEDIKIYINPGHGSWGPNNRHCATLGGHETISTENPDTTDFYESNTNLWKCLELFHRLREYGFKNETGNGLDLTQNVVMSRIASGPYPYDHNNIVYETDADGNPTTTIDYRPDDSNNSYNRTLSVIAQESETFGSDMFFSVHSNAATEAATTNYLYYAYYTAGGADAATCIAMSEANWNRRILDRHTQWSHYDNLVGAGTVKIGSQNFGVLGNQSCNGTLVEGYFHTYQPARHRAMNMDVCQMEGLEYARGIADYYGVATESTGQIYGVVRDLHEKFSDALYTPSAGTDDVYKPLNGVEVTLKQGETTVSTYTTDGNYNGAFVFKNLEPGDYTLEFAHEEYKESEPIAVAVTASNTAYPTAFLENVAYEPPAVVYVNYPDSTAGKSEYMLYPNYKLKAAIDNVAIAELEGKTIRRTIIRNGKAYILALDASNNPYIYLADLAAGTVTELDKAAIALGSNQSIMLSDIALTADHVLVGCSYGKNHYSDAKATEASESRGVIQFYKWTQNADTGLPETSEAWFTTNHSGNFNYSMAGKTFAYSGTLADGTIVVTQETTGPSTEIRMTELLISDGALSSSGYTKPAFKVNAVGSDYELMVSPLAEKGNYVFDAENINPTEWTLSNASTMNGVNDLLNVLSKGANYFKYAGRTLMVAPDVNADGQVQGIKLFDITDGMGSAVEIATNATITPTAYTYASAHGELALTLSADEKSITAADIQLYLVVDGKITKWVERTVSAATPATGGTANPFAYALESEVANNTLSVSYSLNAAAADVNIYVKDSEGTVVLTSEEGALEAGAHTADIDLSALENGDYTWSVEVAGEEKSKVQQFISHSFYHPGGLAVDNSMESPSFGTLFVAEGYSPSSVNASYVDNEANVSGLYIFDPLGNQVLSNAGKERFHGAGLTFDKTLNTTNVGDIIRVAVASDGRIFAARGSDSGDYILYAESLEKLKETGELTSLLTGQTMTSTCVYNDASGNFMLGPVQAMDIYGEGENTKLLVQTRISNDNATYVYSYNRMFEYNIGTGTTLPTPTAVSALDQKYTIDFSKTLTVKYDNEGGIWYCQYCGAPTNAQPALVYVNAAGEIKFFEGDGGPSRRSGAMDVSVDGKYLAAISAPGQVTVYEIMKGADGTVHLRKEYIMTTGGNNMYDLAWDAAGNLYGDNPSNEYIRYY